MVIRSFSGLKFLAFRLHLERYSISLHIQSKCGKVQTRKAPDTDTFHAVVSMAKRFGTKEKWIGVMFFQKQTVNSGKALTFLWCCIYWNEILFHSRKEILLCTLRSYSKLLLMKIRSQPKTSSTNVWQKNRIMLRLYQLTSIVNWSGEDHLACNSKMIHCR